jgi:hypothetical protein
MFHPSEIYPVPDPQPPHIDAAFPHQYSQNLFDAHQNLTANDINNYRLFMGHWDFSAVDRFPSLTPFTMLRDPIPRIISQYHYTRTVNDPWNPLHEELSSVSLSEWAQNHNLHTDIINFQARQLAGCAWSPSEALSDTEIFQQAKRNLEKCVVVGLLERYDEFLFLLAYQFNWALVRHYEHHNISSIRYNIENIDKYTLKALSKLVEIDIELYYYAQQLYNSQITTALQHIFETRPESSHYLQNEVKHQTYAKRIFHNQLFDIIESKLSAYQAELKD